MKGMVSMRLSPDPYELKRAVIIAMFAAVAVVLGIVESLIPISISIPGAKLGLGNIMVITCLIFFSGKDAWMLIILKTILTSFILGTFSTFIFSFFGATFSFLVMYAMLRLGKNQFSLIGVSVVGGITHNIGQLLAASLVLGTTGIFYYLPVLFIAGVVTGIFVGLSSRYLVSSLRSIGLFDAMEVKSR
jgi:heptaprenyl diphosphate synthase